MKKKLFILLVFSCFMLGACGKTNDAGKGKESGQAVDENTKKNLERTDAVMVGDMVLALNGAFEDVYETLGKPLSCNESKSCLYDGYDKTYTYSDVVIITSPIGGTETITSITVLSENVTHRLAAGIGSSAEAVKLAYGAENTDVSEYCIIWEDTFGVAFYLSDGIVTEIEIYVL